MLDVESKHRVINQRIDALVPHVLAWDSTVAIVYFREGKFSPLGTGTLFRIADDSFVVTATHVMKTGWDSDLCISAGKSGIQGRFVPLRGRCLFGDEPSDVAVIHIEHEDAALVEKTFLRLDHVSFDQDLSNGLFSLFGFPEIWSYDENGTYTMRKFFFTTYSYKGDTGSLDGYSPQVHLLLQAGLSEATDIRGRPLEFSYRGGMSAPFPRELRGVSGCSVWRIADGPDSVRAASSDRARIVAVQTGVYHSRECIKATWWKSVVAMIYREYPDLRAAINMRRIL